MIGISSTLASAESINALGIDLLLRLHRPASNTLLSPYSIQCSLILAYAGAEGDTRTEMARVLHYQSGSKEIHQSFADLADSLDEMCRESMAWSERMREVRREFELGWKSDRMSLSEFMKQPCIAGEPLMLLVANRIFTQTGFDLRKSFVELLGSRHHPAFESLDFAKDPHGAVRHINRWAEEQTSNRIRNILPDNSVNRLTRIVLANAIYLRAAWSKPFSEEVTRPLPFYLQTGETIIVPTMTGMIDIGFRQFDGFIALTIPYDTGDLQFTILMPDKQDGIAELGKRLDTVLLKQCSTLETHEVSLHLPKFRLEPPTMLLRRDLQSLGMQTAFDLPPGTANFEGIAPRCEDEYLALYQIYHKTFLSLDEKGTEAAAVTINLGVGWGFDGGPIKKPKKNFVDRPFIFAIQHRKSGACLFLGFLSDPVW